MNFSNDRRTVAILSLALLFSLASSFTHPADAQSRRFHLEEATIADVQRAIRSKQITATQLVQLYFKRIDAYNGTCVKGEVDPATGLMLGDLTPIENAGQLNAYMTQNIRGKRSKTRYRGQRSENAGCVGSRQSAGRLLCAHRKICRAAARHPVRDQR